MTIRVRIRATGQVIDMLPAVACEMLNAGMAEPAPEPVPEQSIARRAVQMAARFLRLN